MPSYDYRCSSCGDFQVVRSFADHNRFEVCSVCGEVCPQVLSGFAFARSSVQTEAVFDHNLGGVVSSPRSREELKKRKEEAAGKNFIWIDPSDAKAAGATSEGLDATNRQKVATGEKSTQLYF